LQPCRFPNLFDYVAQRLRELARISIKPRNWQRAAPSLARQDPGCESTGPSVALHFGKDSLIR